MFMGIGVGAYTAGLFHLVTHAFFKALLFLGSGSVIHALSGEQDIRRMGGLRKYIPTTAITFLIGTLAIAGVPLLSGFYSKDGILGQVYDRGYALHWLLALITVVMTAAYMFRLYLLTFEGKTRMTDEVRHHVHESPFSMTIPLMILAVLSIFGGYLGVPEFIGELAGIHESNLFDKFVSPAILLDNFVAAGQRLLNHVTLLILSIAAAATGIAIAFISILLSRGRRTRSRPTRTSSRSIIFLTINGTWTSSTTTSSSSLSGISAISPPGSIRSLSTGP